MIGHFQNIDGMRFVLPREEDLESVGTFHLYKCLFRMNYWKRSTAFKCRLSPLLIGEILNRIESLPLETISKVYASVAKFNYKHPLHCNSNIFRVMGNEMVERQDELELRVCFDLLVSSEFLEPSVNSDLMEFVIETLMQALIDRSEDISIEEGVRLMRILEGKGVIGELERNIFSIFVGKDYREQEYSNILRLVDLHEYSKEAIMTKAIAHFRGLVQRRIANNLGQISTFSLLPLKDNIFIFKKAFQEGVSNAEKAEKLNLNQKINVISNKAYFLEEDVREDIERMLDVHLNEINGLWSVLKKSLTVLKELPVQTRYYWMNAILNRIDHEDIDKFTSSTNLIYLAFFINEMPLDKVNEEKIRQISSKMLENSHILHKILVNLEYLDFETIEYWLTDSFFIFVMNALDNTLENDILSDRINELKWSLLSFVSRYDYYLRVKGREMDCNKVHLLEQWIVRLKGNSIGKGPSIVGRTAAMLYRNGIIDKELWNEFAETVFEVNMSTEDAANAVICAGLVENREFSGKVEELVEEEKKNLFGVFERAVWESFKGKQGVLAGLEAKSEEERIAQILDKMDSTGLSAEEQRTVDNLESANFLRIQVKMGRTLSESLLKSEEAMLNKIIEEKNFEVLMRAVKFPKYRDNLSKSDLEVFDQERNDLSTALFKRI